MTTSLCRLFHLIGMDKDPQNGASECTPTDYVRHHGAMFPRRINQELSALAHLYVHHRQKSLMVLMARSSIDHQGSSIDTEMLCECHIETSFSHLGHRVR